MVQSEEDFAGFTRRLLLGAVWTLEPVEESPKSVFDFLSILSISLPIKTSIEMAQAPVQVYATLTETGQTCTHFEQTRTVHTTDSTIQTQ